MIQYRKAKHEDIPILIESRLNLLRSANGLEADSDLSAVKEHLTNYYETALGTQEHVAFLAYHDKTFAGTGGICFYRVLPTYHNPTGMKAYIINMYTVSGYRNQGIGGHILRLLIHESLSRGVDFISLEATKTGRSLYEEHGFVKMPCEMQLLNDTLKSRPNVIAHSSSI